MHSNATEIPPLVVGDVVPSAPPTYMYVSDSYIWVRAMKHSATRAKLSRQPVLIDPRGRVDTGKMIKTLLAMSQPFPPFSYVTVNLYGVGAPRTDSVWTQTTEFAVYTRNRPPRTEDEIMGMRRVEPELIADSCFVVGQASGLCAPGVCPGRMIFVTGDANICPAIECALKGGWLTILCAPVDSPGWLAYTGHPLVRLISLDEIVAECTVTHYQLSPGALPMPSNCAFEVEGSVSDNCDSVAAALSRCTGIAWMARYAPCPRRSGVHAIMAVAFVPPLCHDTCAIIHSMLAPPPANSNECDEKSTTKEESTWARRLFGDGNEVKSSPDFASPEHLVHIVNTESERQLKIVREHPDQSSLPPTDDVYLVAAGIKSIRPWWSSPHRRHTFKSEVEQNDITDQGQHIQTASCSASDCTARSAETKDSVDAVRITPNPCTYTDPVSAGPGGLAHDEHRKHVTAQMLATSTYHDAYGNYSHMPTLCVPHCPTLKYTNSGLIDPYSATFLCASGIGLADGCVESMPIGIRPPLVSEHDEDKAESRCWNSFRCTFGLGCRYSHTTEEVRFFVARSVAEHLGWSFVPSILTSHPKVHGTDAQAASPTAHFKNPSDGQARHRTHAASRGRSNRGRSRTAPIPSLSKIGLKS